MLAYPSAFTLRTGAAHWEILLRARAIETQCYVVGAALVGKHHEKRESYGHAMIVDPWGSVIAQCSDASEETLAVAEINLNYLERVRKEMPVFDHRRPDVYQLSLSPSA
jgi:predicted amidohydrolase